MKCLVCGREFSGGACPRCGFPIVESPDIEALLQSLQPTIDAYRERFFGALRVELAACRWREENGRIVPACEERFCFGTGKALFEGTHWLEQPFARIPETEFVTARVCIGTPTAEWEQTVRIPNLNEPGLQRLGLRVDGDDNFCLCLKNEAGSETRSEPLPLFP